MAQDCGKHGYPHKKLLKRISIGLLILITLAIIISLITWATLRATKPEFTIQEATLYTFNVSTDPSLLTTTLQVTITSRNPNDHTSIYYDNLGVYATYRDQQITLPSRVPSVYQGHNEVNVWSPFIFGSLIPVAPYNALALAEDQNMQVVDLVIKMTGRVGYKMGSATYRSYHLDVRCPARITFGSRCTGVVVGNAVKYQLVKRCIVNV